MTTFGTQPRGYQPQDVDVPSPDGHLHAVVVQRGDVIHNTNIFSLLLFPTRALFAAPRPDTLLVLVSSSNRPAISHVKWLNDNGTIALLGERVGELPQVYLFDLRTRHLRPRTHEPTEIINYDITPSGDVLVYTAKPVVDTSSYAAMRAHGFALRPAQFAGDVLMGQWADAASEWWSTTPANLFVQRSNAPAAVRTELPVEVYRSCDPNSLAVAPSGRLMLMRCTRGHAPEAWARYTEPTLSRLLARHYVPPEFAVFDLERGSLEPLVDAPAIDATAKWSPVQECVILANAFLPPDGMDAAESQADVLSRGIAEIDARTHRITTIAHADSLDIIAWDGTTNTIDLALGIGGRRAALGAPQVHYQKTARGWIPVKGRQTASRPLLVVEEGLNLPPHLVALHGAGERGAVVFDPNPQLAGLRLGRERIVRWHTRAGQEWVAGLYLPPDFIPGHRYPLVVQTHGFDSTAFAPDGMYPTANAAQPMAAAGILVLQLGRLNGVTPPSLQEGPFEMEAIEGAIDYLGALGLIDRSRVGLIGFSRTCYHVLYTLTHSRYPIAAAAVTDGVDFSYLQYMVFQNARVGAGWTFDEYTDVNGGPPFGEKLDTWRARAPGFNLDRVRAPVRLEAIERWSVLQEWEAYAGLLLQGKPAELFVIPEGTHLLVKPWERLASSQGNADWFRFWLKGEEDPDPAKAEQYVRWRRLRSLQQISDTAVTN